MDVEHKIADMQKYIPCLKGLIENLEKNKEKEGQVKKMQYLMDMLTRKDLSIKLETLNRCEEVLIKFYNKEPSAAIHSDGSCDQTDIPEKAQEGGQTSRGDRRSANRNKVNSGPGEEPLFNGSLATTNGKSCEVPSRNQNNSRDGPISGEEAGPEQINSTERREVDKKELSFSAATNQNEGVENEQSPAQVSVQRKNSNEGKSKAIVEDQKQLPSAECCEASTKEYLGNVKTTDDATKATPSTNKKLNNEPDSLENSSKYMQHAGRDESILNGQTQFSQETGESDMEIDEELTNSIQLETEGTSTEPSSATGSILQECTGETQIECPSAQNVNSDDLLQVVSKSKKVTEVTSKQPPAQRSAPKSGFVDLTSDDSNDESSSNAKKTQPPSVKRTHPTQAPKRPQAVFFKTNSSKQLPNKVPDPSADPLEMPKIATIDLLDSDSDSDDESKTTSTKNSEPNGQLKMPSPKMLGDKPMFTISSVQSISTLQQHYEMRREVAKNLYAIVKTVQYTTHHTVPQKYNEVVRAYLDKFVKDLLFEKNRVNLCLQKLQMSVQVDKYKQIKKVIQTYCSEPVNDSNLPAPSPFCHRIKVYPEKLQFVMRQLFFFDTAISVIGYKVYSLVHNHQNGVAKAGTQTPEAGKAQPKPTNRLPVIQKVASIADSNSPTKTSSPGRASKPSPSPSKYLSSASSSAFAISSAPASKHSPAPMLRKALTPMPTSPLLIPNDDLLAPMSTRPVSPDPIAPPPKQSRRKKRPSDDDDDDDDENYVPHEYISESDDASGEQGSGQSRRRSLQRASKSRCKKYLELEGSIDDETFIQAAEASITKALKSEKSSKKGQPLAKKAKFAPRSKKQTVQKGNEEASGNKPESDENHPGSGAPDVEQENQSLDDDFSSFGRLRSGNERGEDDDDDCEPPPELDTSKENLAKNITRAYHCRSQYVSRCLICHEKIGRKSGISHYVNSHRDRENYVSRITKSDVMKLQSETMSFAFLSASKGSVNTYVAYCFFCQQEHCLSMRNWWEHYTRHTGEYGFECSACKARRSCRHQMNRHVNIECTQNDGQVVVINELDANAKRIDAYVCLLCFYIQLHIEPLLRHMHTEHEFSANTAEIPEGTYQAVNLLKIEQTHYETNDYPPTVEPSYEVEPQEDMSFMICNMLASTAEQEQTNLEASGQYFTIAALPENSFDNRSQSPEMIIPEYIVPRPEASVGAGVAQQNDAANSSSLVGGNVADVENVKSEGEIESQKDVKVNSGVDLQVKTEKDACGGYSDFPEKKHDVSKNLVLVAKFDGNSESSMNEKETVVDANVSILDGKENNSKKVSVGILGATYDRHAVDAICDTSNDQKIDSNQGDEQPKQSDGKDVDSEKCGENSVRNISVDLEASNLTSPLVWSEDEVSNCSNSKDTVRKSDAQESTPAKTFEIESKDTSPTKPSARAFQSVGNKKDELLPLVSRSNQSESCKTFLTDEINSLTESATERIFHSVTDSVVNSVLESNEVTTIISDSTSELPDSAMTSSASNTSELPETVSSDSVQSGPQFLKPSDSPPKSDLLAIAETSESNVPEPMETTEADSFVIVTSLGANSETAGNEIESGVNAELEEANEVILGGYDSAGDVVITEDSRCNGVSLEITEESESRSKDGPVLSVPELATTDVEMKDLEGELC